MSLTNLRFEHDQPGMAQDVWVQMCGVGLWVRLGSFN